MRTRFIYIFLFVFSNISLSQSHFQQTNLDIKIKYYSSSSIDTSYKRDKSFSKKENKMYLFQNVIPRLINITNSNKKNKYQETIISLSPTINYFPFSKSRYDTYKNKKKEQKNEKTNLKIDSAKLISFSLQKKVLAINCIFEDNPKETQFNFLCDFIKNADNWKITSSKGERVFIDSILYICNMTENKRVIIFGNLKAEEYYQIAIKDTNDKFNNSVDVLNKLVHENEISNLTFANNSIFCFDVRRITNKKPIFVYDYIFESRIIEYKLRNPFLTIPFTKPAHSSFSLDIKTKGAISDNEQIRNGTVNSIGVFYNYYYKDYCSLHGLFKIGLFYFLETGMDSANAKMFNVLNRSSSLLNIALGISTEIPFSRYFNDAIHKITKYSRMAEPIRIKLNFLPEGNDLGGNKTPSRNELTIEYELSLSSFFLLKGEFIRTFFNNISLNKLGKAENYYSLTFAQDLSSLFGTTPFLKEAFGMKTEGNNFIYYMVTSGKHPPLFQSLNEQSIGISITF